MDTKITGLPPIAVEQLVRQDQGGKDPRAVKRIAKSEGSSTKKVGEDGKKISDEEKDRKKSAISGVTPETSEELVKDIQKYLADINIKLSFEVNKEAEMVVVRVLNGKTGEVIRQIPPEELLKLREKLRELRGVLYEGKM